MNCDLHNRFKSYLWRGGEKIAVEQVEDRFTIVPATKESLEKIHRLPGVEQVKKLQPRIYQVRTNPAERDVTINLLRFTMNNILVYHVYRPKGTAGTNYYLTDKIIVKFDPDCTNNHIDTLLEKYQLKVVKSYEKLLRTFLLQMTASSNSGGKQLSKVRNSAKRKSSGNLKIPPEQYHPLVVANQLAEEPFVVWAEPNLINRFRPAYQPTDPYFKRQWHLYAESGPQLEAAASVDAPEAWEISRGERQIVLAVIDDGFDLEHPDFKVDGKIVFPKDYVDGDAHPFPEAENGDYHGTPCAGVALAEINGQGSVGVAPGCAFMPVRFPLNADDDLLVDIFMETASHADVISCSWGTPPVYAPLPTVLNELFTEITTGGGPHGLGVVLVFAAGNFNAPINHLGFPKGFEWLDFSIGKTYKTKGRILNGFAAHPRIIAVGASTSLNRHAAYSNWGEEISVAAPSNNYHPLNPYEYVPGRGIWTIDNERYGLGFTKESCYTGDFGGTSSATPLVAGIAALVRSVNPALTALEVKELLQQTADKIIDPDPDQILTTNRGEYNSNGRCDWFGYGKINAAKAAREALRRKTKIR
jgi:subtilisin family serine protease